MKSPSKAPLLALNLEQPTSLLTSVPMSFYEDVAAHFLHTDDQLIWQGFVHLQHPAHSDSSVEAVDIGTEEPC